MYKKIKSCWSGHSISSRTTGKPGPRNKKIMCDLTVVSRDDDVGKKLKILTFLNNLIYFWLGMLCYQLGINMSIVLCILQPSSHQPPRLATSSGIKDGQSEIVSGSIWALSFASCNWALVIFQDSPPLLALKMVNLKLCVCIVDKDICNIQ